MSLKQFLKPDRRKTLFFGFFFLFIFFVNLVLATPPCYILPSIVNEFENYYENVEITSDTCYPKFSFTTPSYYSRFNVSYKVDSFGYNYVLRENITDYDSNLREEISKIENCSGFEKYIELSDKNTLYLSSFMPDYSNPNKYCPYLQSNIESLEKTKTF